MFLTINVTPGRRTSINGSTSWTSPNRGATAIVLRPQDRGDAIGITLDDVVF
jgi:hypothetical protein